MPFTCVNVAALGVDPDEMRHYAAFHLGLHFPKVSSIQRAKVMYDCKPFLRQFGTSIRTFSDVGMKRCYMYWWT